MKYRKLGKTNEEVSILGFGCMRFPEIDKKIDEEKTIEMVRYAIDNGVNYIDTAYPYHHGESEVVVGKILKDGYREKVKLATKLPTWLIKSREDMDKYLDEQLKKLDTDYIDFYLVHNLNKETYENAKANGLFDFLDSLKNGNKVKHVGFSFHDTLDVYKQIVDEYDWKFAQIQYNYLDEEYQAGREGLLYAKEKGLGIIIMEPLRGGALVNNLSDKINDIINSSTIKKNAAGWAFKFLYDNEDISMVLSGMSNIEQVKDNLKIVDEEGTPNSMLEEEKEVINNLRNEFKSKIKVNCTGCKYCVPCPANVDIPTCFHLLNNASMFDNKEKIKASDYKFLVKIKADASQCLECGKCEDDCPQHIKIREVLKELKNTFEG